MKTNDSKLVNGNAENDPLTIKYELIAHLILKYKLNIRVICELTPKEFAQYIDNDIKNDVATYVNKNGDRIKETKFFFYGKAGGASSPASIVAGLRKNLSASVFNSLNISSLEEKEKFLATNSTIQDMQDFLKNI